MRIQSKTCVYKLYSPKMWHWGCLWNSGWSARGIESTANWSFLCTTDTLKSWCSTFGWAVPSSASLARLHIACSEALSTFDKQIQSLRARGSEGPSGDWGWLTFESQGYHWTVRTSRKASKVLLPLSSAIAVPASFHSWTATHSFFIHSSTPSLTH